MPRNHSLFPACASIIPIFWPTDAFNNAASHARPINSDSYVRSCCDPSENAILRLQIRDFKGSLQDCWSIFQNFK